MNERRWTPIRNVIFLGLLLCFVSALFSSSNDSPRQGSHRFTYTIAPSVAIDGNSQLAAESSSGNGSITNPYIIEGKIISGNGTAPCISIANTNSFFILRNCIFSNGSNGIHFGNVQNGQVLNVIITHSSSYGIFWENADFNKITNSSSMNNTHNGFFSTNSDHNMFYNSNFSKNLNGIVIFAATNNSIINCTLSENVGSIGDGIAFSGGVTSCRIINNTIQNNKDDGVSFSWDGNHYNIIVGNNISSNNDDGVSIDGSNSLNKIYDNSILANRDDGIYIHASLPSTGNEIIGNIIADSGIPAITNADGIFVNSYVYRTRIENNSITRCYRGIHLNSFIFHTQVIGNDISGNRNAGAYLISTVHNTTFDGNQIWNNNGNGIWLNDFNTTIKNCFFDANANDGILVHAVYGNNTNIINNTFTNHLGAASGLTARDHTGGFYANNTFYKNYRGMSLYNAASIRVIDNLVCDNSFGIIAGSGNYTCNNTVFRNNLITNNTIIGIEISTEGGNNFGKNNTVENNIFDHDGTGLLLIKTRDNIIKMNIFRNNMKGIQYTTDLGPNTFFRNDFLHNVLHVENSRPDDIWDNGYPSGGNYWANCTLTDMFTGPSQNMLGHDGLGDTRLDLPGGGQDRYPLMEPFRVDEIAPRIELLGLSNNSIIPAERVIQLDVWDSRLYTVLYNWDTNANQTLTTPYEVVAPGNNGTHILRVQANDTFGNIARKIFVFTVDKTSPIILLESPANTSIIIPGSFIDFTILDASALTVQYRWNASTWFWLNSPYDVIVPSTEGLAILTIFAMDGCLNSMQLSLTFIIDETPPQIILVSPTNNTAQKPGILVNLEILEMHLNSVIFNWNGSLNQTLSSPFDLTMPASDGLWILGVFANDLANNRAQATFQFIVDGTQPLIIPLGFSNVSILTRGTYLNFSIIEANMDTVEKSINGSMFSILSAPYSVLLPQIGSSWIITIRSTDNAGNSATVSFNIIAEIHPVANFIPNSTSIIAGSNVGFTFTGTLGNAPLYIEWNFGDGSVNSSELNPVHHFSRTGDFFVKLTIIDVDGDVSTHAIMIQVRDAPADPLYTVLSLAFVIIAGLGVVIWRRNYKHKMKAVNHKTRIKK